MTAMMKELGFEARGGTRGTSRALRSKSRACRVQIHDYWPRPTRYTPPYPRNPFKSFDVWFPPSPDQGTLWPSEIVLTDEYFYSLKDHAIPFDFRALKAIQQKPRAQDIYLWMTQRLCRIETGKPC